MELEADGNGEDRTSVSGHTQAHVRRLVASC